MENFLIDKITLHNFKKFEELTVCFNQQMNVLVGKNASGKTTVLEAATVIAGAMLSSFKEYVPSRFVQNLSDSDVRLKNQTTVALRKSAGNQSRVAPLLAAMIQQYPCNIAADIVWDEKKARCVRSLEKAGGRTKFDGDNPFRHIVGEWEEAIRAADGRDSDYIFPIVLYLSSARLWNENRGGQDLQTLPNRYDAYQRCLDRKRGSQLAFMYLKLLQNLAAEETEGKPLGAYRVILAAVNYAMQGELADGQMVKYSSRYGEFVLGEKDGSLQRFETLSDGYRNVIKIIVDIAARMCILNPYLAEDALQQTPGIVMIDELDLSLHPTWQKRMVDILKTLFPKVQFICATHSPFIIQSLSDGELCVMGESLTDEYSGRSIEDIAEDIMKVSMPAYSDRKKAMFEAATAYLQALKSADSPEQIAKLKERADLLEAEYSDNPAYYALLRMKWLEKKASIE